MRDRAAPGTAAVTSTFSGAVLTASEQPEAASEVLTFLRSVEAKGRLEHTECSRLCPPTPTLTLPPAASPLDEDLPCYQWDSRQRVLREPAAKVVQQHVTFRGVATSGPWMAYSELWGTGSSGRSRTSAPLVTCRWDDRDHVKHCGLKRTARATLSRSPTSGDARD